MAFHLQLRYVDENQNKLLSSFLQFLFQPPSVDSLGELKDVDNKQLNNHPKLHYQALLIVFRPMQ